MFINLSAFVLAATLTASTIAAPLPQSGDDLLTGVNIIPGQTLPGGPSGGYTSGECIFGPSPQREEYCHELCHVSQQQNPVSTSACLDDCISSPLDSCERGAAQSPGTSPTAGPAGEE
ncbi:hypothetical protein BDV06DRAFT_220787 [Aspergillus oleicola]